MSRTLYKTFGILVSLSVVFIAPAAFAQVVVPGLTSMDTAALPGSEAPASPAPVGKMSSDWMSHEDSALISQNSAFSLPTANRVQAEEQARLEESQLVRKLVLARSQGRNIDPAARNQWLGTISLARGDEAMAENYFHRAEVDLQTDQTARRHVDALGLGDDANAANLHPNTDTATSY
jgi:hypothetical protein